MRLLRVPHNSHLQLVFSLPKAQALPRHPIIETVTCVHPATFSFVLSPHKFKFEAMSLCHSLHAVSYHYRCLKVLRNSLVLTILVSHDAEEGSLCGYCLADHLFQFPSSELGLSLLLAQVRVHRVRAPHRHSQTCCFLSDPVDYLSSACGIEIPAVPVHEALAAGVARRLGIYVAIGTVRGCFPVVVTPQVVSFVHRSLDRYQIYCEWAGIALSHLVPYAVAVAGFLSRRGRLPELGPLPASLGVGLSAPHLGFPLVRSWNPKVHLPNFL